MAQIVTNLESLLSDIYVQYVQIQDDDFQLHYKVVDSFFRHLHQKMGEVDPYYSRHSSTVKFGGSHYDNVRIVKPDEFDLIIEIGLPVSIQPQSQLGLYYGGDVLIELKKPGFVQLRLGAKFQCLKQNEADWPYNKAAYQWIGRKQYLQRSNFMDWFKSVVNKALNTFEQRGYQPRYVVDGVPYTIRRSESGPAMTVIIENESQDFKLDVDLVPALRIPESRWPLGRRYRRKPPQCARGDWKLVPKSIKNGNVYDEQRSWRVARPDQERQLIHDSGNLRQAWRLTKKLRDSLDMHKIASYFIKNLFFWEIVEKNDADFWHRTPTSTLFKLMVGKLYQALLVKDIPFFWNRRENLLARVEDSTLVEYAAKVRPLVQVLEDPKKYKHVAQYLLSPEEFIEYNVRFLHI